MGAEVFRTLRTELTTNYQKMALKLAVPRGADELCAVMLSCDIDIANIL